MRAQKKADEFTSILRLVTLLNSHGYVESKPCGFFKKQPSQQTDSGHHRTAREMPFEWHFPGGPKVVCVYMLTCIFIIIINEPVHEISNNVVSATSKASDQPAHTRSLTRAFASRLSIL